MSEKHPYISSPQAVVKCIEKFCNALPNTINATTLKKLSLAPNNETYLINILRFLKLVDDKGNPTEGAKKVFSTHPADIFKKEFAKVVKEAYADLFGLHAEKTWALNKDDLVTYFRSNDQTSSAVAQRQARTFKALSFLSGNTEPNDSVARAGKKSAASSGRVAKKDSRDKGKGMNKTSATTEEKKSGDAPVGSFGLTVRIEINLPVSDDKKTYDNIFKSIKENLLNG